VSAKEIFAPTHDWVLLDKIEHTDMSPGGLVMPQPGSYESLRQQKYKNAEPDRDIQKHKSRETGRFSVLAVGPGSYVDFADEIHNGVFMRKPMCCDEGDTVLVQEGANPITVNGKVIYATHDYNILAVIKDPGTPDERLDPKHDYIFARQATAIRQSTGGIYMPGAEDPTGTRALPDRWEALGVGDGPWALRQERNKITEFARRPMVVKTGDIFAFEGAGFEVIASGAKMICVQNYQVAGLFHAL